MRLSKHIALVTGGTKGLGRAPSDDEWVGTGRELFASMRAAVGPADQGASVFRSIT